MIILSAVDEIEAAFNAGFEAFSARLRPLDNPYFADAERVVLFDAWSDGWHTARDASLPEEKRLLTQLRTEPWWKRSDLPGITATWGFKPVHAEAAE